MRGERVSPPRSPRGTRGKAGTGANTLLWPYSRRIRGLLPEWEPKSRHILSHSGILESDTPRPKRPYDRAQANPVKIQKKAALKIIVREGSEKEIAASKNSPQKHQVKNTKTPSTVRNCFSKTYEKEAQPSDLERKAPASNRDRS